MLGSAQSRPGSSKTKLRATSAPPSAAYGRQLEAGGVALDAFLELEGLPSIRRSRHNEEELNAILQMFVQHLRKRVSLLFYQRLQKAKHGRYASKNVI